MVVNLLQDVTVLLCEDLVSASDIGGQIKLVRPVLVVVEVCAVQVVSRIGEIVEFDLCRLQATSQKSFGLF